MLSRTKPATGPGSNTPAKDQKKKKKLPKLEDFLQGRDYTGAITLLEVKHMCGHYHVSPFEGPNLQLWPFDLVAVFSESQE